jgi:uncharacterized protein YkwD
MKHHRTPLLLALALLALLAAAAAALAEGPWKESYADRAEVEAIYGTAKDELTPQQAAELLMAYTNDARQDAGLSVVVWSPVAAKLAGEHARDMTANRYVSHYDLEGRKCEQRFNALGQTDNVAENLSFYEIGYSIKLTPQLVQRLHSHWMQSDSHRDNILNPAHTHFGCAFALNASKRVTYVSAVEEFASDYGSMEKLPAEVQPGDVLRIEGNVDPARARLMFIGLGSEDLPFKRTPEYQLAHIGGYSPPEPALQLLPRQYEGRIRAELRHARYEVDLDPVTGRFSVELKVEDHWPKAAYYISVWAEDIRREGDPFCAMTQVVLVH